MRRNLILGAGNDQSGNGWPAGRASPIGAVPVPIQRVGGR